MDRDRYSEKRYDIQREGDIDTEILEAIPFDYPESATEVIYETDEFTCVCPWTGLPDFGTVTISYMPDEKLIELKSLKYYLTSFRNVGIIQEHAINRILNDLVELVQPVTMMIEAEYRERGGIRTEASVVYEREDFDEMDDLNDPD